MLLYYGYGMIYILYYSNMDILTIVLLLLVSFCEFNSELTEVVVEDPCKMPNEGSLRCVSIFPSARLSSEKDEFRGESLPIPSELEEL